MMTGIPIENSLWTAYLLTIFFVVAGFAVYDVLYRRVPDRALVFCPSGMALVFLTAAVTAMPVIFLLRRLYRTGQPLAIPFLPFLACGCCTATLAQLFLR